MTKHLPCGETPREDHDQAPSGADSHPKADGPGTADPASTPGRDALKTLVRLLARQAAREHVRSQGADHGA